MNYTTTQKRDYAWMAQASYLDFQGLSAGTNDALVSKLNNQASINSAKIFAEEQINIFVDSKHRLSICKPSSQYR